MAESTSTTPSDLSLIGILLIATKNNEFNEIKQLLESRKVNVNYVADSTHHITPLHVAAESGLLNIAQLLLEHNADINMQTLDGVTPLHLAIQLKRVDVAQYLIQCGADVNITDKWGWTPLHNISTNGYSLTVLTDLIKEQINIDAKINDGRTALHLATDCNLYEVAHVLIECGAAIEAPEEKNWTPLHTAAYKGSVEVGKLLIEKGANIESKTNRSTTPLQFAADYNSVPMIELLLQNGANIHALHDTGWTPLHFAAEKGHVECVTSLLQHGANVNFADKPDHITALHCACRLGRDDAIKTLITAGANVNATMIRNATPLHMAVWGDNTSTIDLLLRNGAYIDTHVEDMFPSTPMIYAQINKNADAINKFKLIDTLFSSIINNNSSGVERCIRVGVILDCKSTQWESPLLYVAKMGYIRILSSLLQQSININITNEDNATPLHNAAQNKHFKIVTTLLKHGAIFNIETKKEHKTPLDYAHDKDTLKILTLTTELFNEMSGDKQKAIEKINYLKKQSRTVISAIINAHNKDGHTLLQVADINKHKDIVDMIEIELQLSAKMESHSLKKK